MNEFFDYTSGYMDIEVLQDRTKITFNIMVSNLKIYKKKITYTFSSSYFRCKKKAYLQLQDFSRMYNIKFI